MDRFMPEATQQARIEMLEANAEKIEERTYSVPLDEADVTKYEKELVTASLEESALLNELALIKKDFQERIKEHAQTRLVNLQILKQQAVEEKGKVYLLLDRESKVATYYNQHGYVVQSRPMTKEENQLQLGLRKAM